VRSIADTTFYEKLRSEYLGSLKPPETEELINQIINRPIAFATAKLFHTMRVRPNLVTLFSLLCGVSAGVLFSRGGFPDALWAGVLLQLMIIFDCADGQLARMTNRSTRLGRILDTLADLTTHCAIFWGVAIGLYRNTGSVLPFFLALLSQISMYYHMALFDHFKNKFVTIAMPQCADQLDSLDSIKNKIDQLETKNSALSGILKKIFLWFSKMEHRVVSIGYPSEGGDTVSNMKDTPSMDAKTRELYYREMRVPTKLWTMIADTIHLTIFVVCGVLNRVSLIFPLILLYTNAVMVVALCIQRVKYRSFGLDQDVRWRERFD
jgi:phosphatidylglycerophosphate synthase